MGKIKQILPGEILEQEFLNPMGISAYRLSKEINIPATRISEILKGKRRISVDTALRFSKYFGNSAEFWIGIQNDYEIRKERTEKAKELNKIRELALV
ncbi:transcriptional regulator [Spirochaetia bacterium]|nr:transcriptional regulator [Spirochaetia bacterium]